MVDLSTRWPLGLGTRNWWITVAAALVALGVALAFDREISLWAQGLNREIVSFLAELTRYGESDWILIPAGVLLIVTAAVAYFVRWKLMRTMLWQFTALYGIIFVGVGAPSIFTTIIKRFIGRSRPQLFDEYGTTLHFVPNFLDWTFQSFPSGHTTTAFALAAVLGFLAPRWFGAVMVFAAAVGFSRIAVGMHYPSDVVGGALVGLIGAYGVRLLFARRGWGFRIAPDGSIHQRQMSSLKRYLQLKRRETAAKPLKDRA